MIIKTSYNSIMNVLNLMALTTSTKAIQEDYKVVNFFVKDTKLHALGTDGQLYCMDVVDGTYDLQGEENPFMVLYIKDMQEILNKYSSLQRTQVKEVVLSTQQKGVVMTVIEEPKELKGDDTFAFSDMYKGQSTRYKLARANVKPMIIRELPSLVLPDGAIEMQSKDLQKYLEYMYTPMSRPRETAHLTFSDEYVYSILGNVFGLAMPNTLPQEIFTNLTISLQTMNFLRNVIPMNDTFKIYKEVKNEVLQQTGIPKENWATITHITLYIQSGNTIMKINATDRSKDGNAMSFKQVLPNAVEVDKPYLVDSLKRIEGYDQVYVEINITEDENVVGTSRAEFIIKTSHTVQRIPVKSAYGSGSFKFMLRPETLNLMTFSHLTKDLDGNSDKINDLTFYMDMNNTDTIALCCNDRSELWKTRFPKAPHKEAPLLDF